MNSWFECKVIFEKLLENGMRKKVNEPYLVDALSFTEAEARIIEKIKPFMSGEFVVSAVGRKRISELFFNEKGDRFYEAKIYYITFDEKSNTEKRTASKILIQASSVKEAIDVLEKGMKDSLAGYVLTEIKETAIEDVFPFEKEEDKDEYIEPVILNEE